MAETSLKRSELRHTYAQAQRTGVSLLVALEAGHEAAHAVVQGGRFTTSISGGGISRTMATDRRFSPGDTLEAFEELLSLYDTAVVHTSSGDDAALYTEMMGLLVPVRESTPDYSGLRI